MDGIADSKRKKLFWILIVLEIVMIVAMILAGQLQRALINAFMRVILLLVANFCVQSTYAIFYSALAVFSGLSLIDPIGLYLSGHGERKNFLQNIMCIVGFFMCIALAYIGYLYFKELKAEEAGQPSAPQDDNYSYFGNITQDNQNRRNNQNQTYSYGGSNYLYQNPSGDSNNAQNTRNTNNRSNWQPFSGQGQTIG